MKYAQACRIAEKALKLIVGVEYHCHRFRDSFEAATQHVDVTDCDQDSLQPASEDAVVVDGDQGRFQTPSDDVFGPDCDPGNPQVALEGVAAEAARIDELLEATRQLRSRYPEAQEILTELQRVSSELSFAYADANLEQPVLGLAVGICCRITQEFDSVFSSPPLNLDAAEVIAALPDDVYWRYQRLYLVAGLVDDVQSPVDAAELWGYEDPGVYDGLPSIYFAFQRSGDVVHSLYRLAKAQLPDGPLVGFLWVKDGETIEEQMMPTVWRFVNHLWGKQGKSSHANVALNCNPDSDLGNPETTVGSWRKGANNFFKQHGIPWRVSSRKGMFKLSQISDGNNSSHP